MKLIVITPSKDVPDEQSLITRMFESGLGCLHLRKPKYTTHQMTEYLKEIPPHFHNRIVIHSHHKLALKFKLGGIHLSHTHLTKKWHYFFTRMRLKFKFGKTSKSRSYSRLQQIYSKEEQNFDYYLIGTMYNSMTGEFYSGFYEAGITSAIRSSGKRLIARGGTSPSVVAKTAGYGFAGIAFNSYIWNSDSPFDSFKLIVDEFKANNIPLA